MQEFFVSDYGRNVSKTKNTRYQTVASVFWHLQGESNP